MTKPPRYAPSLELPNARGGPASPELVVTEAERALLPDRWRECAPYLFAVDLFNAERFFAAHEVWEDLWQSPPPAPSSAHRELLRALIQAAAAMIKRGSGSRRGFASLTERSASGLERAASLAEGELCGIDPLALARELRALAALPDASEHPTIRLRLE